jgi:predicted nucleic acid-binding protein
LRKQVWVENACLPASGNIIFIAEITTVEITSAIVRRRKGGSLSVIDATNALTQFDADLRNEYFVLEINSTILTEARKLVGNYNLRSLDAIQLAVAVIFNREQLANGLPSLIFVSADIELLNAASQTGLLIENPNNYP